MATRVTTSFSGTGYLVRNHDAIFNPSGDFYIAFWFKPSAGFTGTALAAKSSVSATNSSFLFLLEAITGKLVWLAWNGVAPNSPTTVNGPTLSAGTWYFIEAMVDRSNLLTGVAATAAGSSLAAFTTASIPGPMTNSTTSITIGGQPTIGSTFGDVHSVVLSGKIPQHVNPTLREKLYRSGIGSSYWEIDDSDFRDAIMAAWDCSETSGTRRDQSGNGMDASVSGTVGTATRTYTVLADHAAYGPIYHLASLLSQCPAFRAITGTVDQASALAKVYYSEVSDAETSNPRPWAVISIEDPMTEDATGILSRGTATVLIEAPVSGGVDTLEARTIFENMLGKTVEEMQVRSRYGGNIVLQNVAASVPLAISNKGERNVPRYYSSTLKVTYGLGG
ncbi:MAG: hypothetical protein EB060_08670 [Proteobacteria bacterium]|nr:hypothetical protein [Pseudomonadota bacterium]